jgi:hypothetical protein
VGQGVAYLFGGITDRIMRRGNMVALQEFLGKALAGFELSRGHGGAEGAPASSGEFVDHAEHQRQFRADHGEIGLDAIGEFDHRVEALHIDRDALRFVGDAAIAGRAVDFRDPR